MLWLLSYIFCTMWVLILLFLTPGCIVCVVVLGSEGRANLQRRQTGGRGHPFTMSSKICSILKNDSPTPNVAFQRYSVTVQKLSTYIRKRHPPHNCSAVTL